MSAAAPDTPAASTDKPRRRIRRLLRRALIVLLLLPALLVLIAGLLLCVPSVQRSVGHRAAAYLSGKTGTTVQLDGLHLGFPLDVKLDGLYIADLRNDTLLYAGAIRTRVGLRALLDRRLWLKQVELSDVRAILRQDPDSTFNFQFIVDAFAGKGPGPETAAGTNGGFKIDLGKLRMENIRFDMDMAPSELGLRARLGELEAQLDTFSVEPMRFIVDAFTIRHTTVALRTTSSEPEPPSYPALTNPLVDIDIQFNTIGMEDVGFTMTTTDTGDSLWVSLLHGELQARSMDHIRQQVVLKDVQLAGIDLGMVSRAQPEPDTASGPPPWLDQHDGFRYWTQDWDLAIDHLAISNSRIAFHTNSIATPTLLLDPTHLAFTGVGLGARAVHMNNELLAMKLDSLTVHGGPKGDRVDLSAHLDASTASLSLTEGRITALDNSFTFRATATPGDLSVVYRTPEAVPLDAEVSGDLRLADLLPLLHQLGLELPAEAATEERWTTKLSVTGTAQNIERAGIELDGDQGSRLYANGRSTNPTQWPNSDYALTIEDLTMGTGMRQLMFAFAPPDVPLPERLALRGDVQGRGYDASAMIDLKSDLGDLSGHAEAHGWKGALPDGIDVDLTADHIAAERLTGDTALGPMSFTLVAKGDGLHGPSRNGTLTFAPTQLSYHGNDL